MTDFTQIRYAVEGGIATITLSRPDKLNAFTGTMMAELIAAFDATDADDAVRAVIVTGDGRAFCAGADLSAGAATFDYAALGHGGPVRPDGSTDYAHEAVRDGGGQVTLRIFQSLKPVIAAINGPAVGIGITMTLAMDIRIMADTARAGLRLRPPRHRPRGGVELVPAAHRRHRPGARVVLLGPGVRRSGGACRPAGQPGRARRRPSRHRDRARPGDRRPRRAGVGRADPADAVADARRRLADGRAPRRQPGDLEPRPLGRRARGCHGLHREAAGAFRRLGRRRYARLLSLVDGGGVPLTARHRGGKRLTSTSSRATQPA